MKIVVKSRSPGRKAFIENAALFFAKQLGLEKSKYELIIHSKPQLKQEGSNGLCAKTGYRKVAIAVYNRLDTLKLLYTLAHEMVHAKQFAFGQYKQEYKNRKIHHYWMGKKVVATYINRPWEIEAFSRESLLVEILSEHVTEKFKNKKT
jgi:hypothetical protein